MPDTAKISDEGDRPVWIVEGAFGRVMLSDSARGLVEHAHAQPNILFNIGAHPSLMRCGTQLFSLASDNMLLFNPWQPHAKIATRQRTVVLSLLLDPAWLAATFHLDILANVFACTSARVTEPIKTATERLLCAMQSPEGRTSMEGQVKEIVGAVLSSYGQRRSLAARNGRPSDFRIKRAKAYIDANISEGLRLEEVARRVGLSRSHFFKQFRRCIGVPPHCYLDWVRLALATHWLATSNRPVLELSEHLGFSAQSHFTRFFSQHLGVSPVAYRRRIVSRTPG
jgi:AraC-like DNA-binding protein